MDSHDLSISSSTTGKLFSTCLCSSSHATQVKEVKNLTTVKESDPKFPPAIGTHRNQTWKTLQNPTCKALQVELTTSISQWNLKMKLPWGGAQISFPSWLRLHMKKLEEKDNNIKSITADALVFSGGSLGDGDGHWIKLLPTDREKIPNWEAFHWASHEHEKSEQKLKSSHQILFSSMVQCLQCPFWEF